MKKLLSLAFVAAAILCCITGCGEIEKYNSERFCGVVRFSEESNQLIVFIPSIGDVAIPESEGCCSCFDGCDDEKNYQIKEGDLVAIYFRYKKSWDDNSVKIMEIYPARFDRNAYLIEALEENITFYKNDAGYSLSFPAPLEIKSAEIGDSLYFIQHGGENGRAYKKLYASGKITAKDDGIFTVELTIHESDAEFLDYYTRLSVELTWAE